LPTRRSWAACSQPAVMLVLLLALGPIWARVVIWSLAGVGPAFAVLSEGEIALSLSSGVSSGLALPACPSMAGARGSSAGPRGRGVEAVRGMGSPRQPTGLPGVASSAIARLNVFSSRRSGTWCSHERYLPPCAGSSCFWSFHALMCLFRALQRSFTFLEFSNTLLPKLFGTWCSHECYLHHVTIPFSGAFLRSNVSLEPFNALLLV